MSRAVETMSVGSRPRASRVSLGPAERRKRPERRREPGVEHVLVLPEPALLHPRSWTARSRPRWCGRSGSTTRDPLSPPELPRDSRGGFSRASRERRRPGSPAELHPALADRLYCGCCELFHVHVPLLGDERLDPRPWSGRSGPPSGDTTRVPRAGRAPATTRGSASRPPPVAPARSPACSFIRPSRPMTVSSGRPWSRPISKSKVVASE